jgi:molybdate transport repressor ModE-like protein
MEMHHHAFKVWLLSLVKTSGSMSQAAREAKLTASAVSQALAQLEASVGQALLARSERGTVVTAAGERLLHILAPAISALGSFDPAALRTPGAPPKLRLGAYESIAIDMVPPLISQLRIGWPGIHISLQINRSRNLLELLADDKLDVALVADPPADSRFVSKVFAYDSFGLFIHRSVASGHDLAMLLERYGLGVLKQDDHLHTRSFAKFMKSLSIQNSTTLETWSFEVILALARAGTMVGVLPLRVADRCAREIVRVDRPARKVERDPGRHPLAVVCRPHFSKALFSAIAKSLGNQSQRETE